MSIKNCISLLIFGLYSGICPGQANTGNTPLHYVVRLPDERLSLRALNEFIWSTPGKMIEEVPSPVIIVDRYEVKGVIHNLINDTISLPSNARQVVIHFTTPDFSTYANLPVSYSLVEKGKKPSEQSWLPIHDGDTRIHLGNITSGSCQLYIRKLNGSGSDHYTYKIVTLIVPLRWYQTVLFKICCIMILLAVVFSYFRLRSMYLENRSLQLKSLVDERTNEIQSSLDFLSGSEKELSRQMVIQSRLVEAISHDVKTPLKFVRMVSKKMSDLILQKDFEAASEMNKNIEDAVSGMYNLLVNLTDYIKNQIHTGQLSFENVGLDELVTSKINFFSTISKQSNNRIFNKIPAGLTAHSHELLLGILIHNLLDNAIKYSENGTIRIFSKPVDNALHLIIADSGPGMPASLVQWLCVPAAEESDDQLLKLCRQYNGLGLIIVKEISCMLHIRLMIDVNKGTAIHLIFPDH